MNEKTRAQEQTEVLSTIETMVSAFEAGNLEEVMATYEPGATIIFEPGNPVSGTRSIEQAFKQAFEMSPKYTFEGYEVFVTGNMAVHFTPWNMSGRMPDGTVIQQKGLSVAVLRKQEDGKWLILFDNPHGQHLMSKQQN